MFFSLPSSGISWCLVLTKLRSKLLHGVFLLAKPFLASRDREHRHVEQHRKTLDCTWLQSLSPFPKSEDENWMLKLNLTKPMKQPLSLKLAFWTLFIKTNLFCSKNCQQNLVFSGLSFSTLSFIGPNCETWRGLQTGGVFDVFQQSVDIFQSIYFSQRKTVIFWICSSKLVHLLKRPLDDPKVAAVFVCFVGSFSSCRTSLPLHGTPLGPKQSFHLLFQPVMRYSRVQDRATQPFINEVDIDTSSRNQLPGLLTCYWSLDLSPNPLQMGAYTITKKTVLSRCPDFPMISLLTSAPWTLWMSKSKQNWAILYFWFFSFNGITGSASSFTFAPFDRVQINPT